MNFIDEKLEEYISAHSQAESQVLQEINRKTHLTTVMPQMLSGNLQGKFLGLLASLSGAQNIVEIGTFTGYSAIAMAEMTGEDTRIHTMEVDEELEDTIRKNIAAAGFENKIELHMGDAHKLLKELDLTPDFVFIDADKTSYPDYYDLLLPMMKSGGIIVADNVLWGGKVLQDDDKCQADTLAIKKFNDTVQNDDRVINIMLPLRDGLMIIVKK